MVKALTDILRPGIISQYPDSLRNEGRREWVFFERLGFSKVCAEEHLEDCVILRKES